MHCHMCNKSAPFVTLFRVNEKGVPGIWACYEHWPKDKRDADPELDRIVKVLQQKG